MSVHHFYMRGRGRLGRATPLVRPGPIISPVETYLARLAPQTRSTKRWEAGVIARALGWPTPQSVPWHALAYQETVLAFSRIDALPLGLSTRRHLRGTLKAILREAWRAGDMTADAMMRASDVAPVHGTPPPAGRALTRGEAHKLLVSFDGTVTGVRDKALCVLLLATGLRRAEAAALQLADYAPTTGAVLVRRGKGSKAREAVITDPAARAIVAAWLDRRGPTAGPLFCQIGRWGDIRPSAGLSGVRIGQMVRAWGVSIGLALTPHDLRRTAITWLLDGGVPLDLVQSFAGHSNPTTTLAYHRRQGRSAAQAAQSLRLPL